jgi:hypothetical protein
MEHIRLTDDKLLNELTFDKSDVFYWLTQQAKRGVASAQVNQYEISYKLCTRNFLFSFSIV